MKDEEMAKQFADNISGLELTCSLLSAKDKSHSYRLGRYDGFLTGLKAGRPQWHDLRKDPKDLPNGHRVVLNQVGMATQYDPNRGFLGFGGAGIIAWCEIPTFDKE